MSVDLFIWSKKKLQSGNQLLLDNGYQNKGDYYERTDESDTWIVNVSCEAISDEHRQYEILEIVQKFVPEVNYYTEINFMGSIPDDVIEGTMFHKLAVDLDGILDDPNSGTFQDENGQEIYSYIEESSSADKHDNENALSGPYRAPARKPMTKEQIKRIFIHNFIMLGVLLLVFMALVIMLLSMEVKTSIIILCSILVLSYAFFLLFLAFRYKKYLQLNKECGDTVTAQSQNVYHNIQAGNQADNGGFDDEEYDSLSTEAATYHYDANKRRFTFQDEKSDKFWHVNRIGEYYYVHYGKNGTFGRIEIKEAENESTCIRLVDKVIAEKLGKGYTEIKDVVADDEFEKAKSGYKPALDSMYIMFHDDEPLIYIAAIKAACERFCDIMRFAIGNKEKIIHAVKAVVLCLNQYAEDPGLIETEERDILGPWTDAVAALAGYEDPDDLAGEWREW